MPKAVPLRCVTRPGRLLCLVGEPAKNVGDVIAWLHSVAGGLWATVVPVGSDGTWPTDYGSVLETSDPDYLVCFGDVPVATRAEAMKRCRLPEELVVPMGISHLTAWTEHGRQLRTTPVSDMINMYNVFDRGPSSLPVPIAALTGVAPVNEASIVLEKTQESPHEYELKFVLAHYRRRLGQLWPESMPVVDPGSYLFADDLHILVGSGDDIADFFTYRNILRSETMRSRCIWLPAELFEPGNLTATLDHLYRWVLHYGEPNYLGTQKPPLKSATVSFASNKPGLSHAITEHGASKWVPQNTLPAPAACVAFVVTSVADVLGWPQTEFGHHDDVLATVNDDARWSVLLPQTAAYTGPQAVTEVLHAPWANIPKSAFEVPTGQHIRSSARGLVIYRSTPPQGAVIVTEHRPRYEALTIEAPSDFLVMERVLNTTLEPSDKAGPILALLQQTDGIENAVIFKDPTFFELVSDMSLESIHKRVKANLPELEGKTGAVFEQTADKITSSLANDIRRYRIPWLSAEAMDKRGIDRAKLLRMGLLETALRLECPKCLSKGYYQPALLAGFSCTACGWTGPTPLPAKTGATYYAPRQLLHALAINGGLPVVLTLLEIHRQSPAARSFPGLLLPSGGNQTREVDIAVWHNKQLFFYEVKHSGKHAIADAAPFVSLCQQYNATPSFAAFDELDSLAQHLATIGLETPHIMHLKHPRAGQEIGAEDCPTQ